MLLGLQEENGTTRSDDDDGHRQFASAVARTLPSTYCSRSVTQSSIVNAQQYGVHLKYKGKRTTRTVVSNQCGRSSYHLVVAIVINSSLEQTSWGGTVRWSVLVTWKVHLASRVI